MKGWRLLKNREGKEEQLKWEPPAVKKTCAECKRLPAIVVGLCYDCYEKIFETGDHNE